MSGVDDARLRAFLAQTLALWQVEGEVVAAEAPGVAAIRAGGGRSAWIERATLDSPFRWLVRWRDQTNGSIAQPRTRPCGSLVGLLNALRTRLDVHRGSPVRVAAPIEGSPPQAADAASFGIEAQSAATRRNRPARPGDESARVCLPVTVLTGFLGSGKTTLLGRLLRHPAMGRTAVIVNEFGEIGLDHDLIETSDESLVQLSNGCLCCNVRSDLVLTLNDLAARRRSGAVPAFERVVIETSGLADPAPILHALMTDPGVRETYALAGVVTTVDSITGLTTLDEYEESVRQAALADTIVLTKSDLPQSRTARLEARLAAMNPEARTLTVVRGAIDPSALLDPAHSQFGRRRLEQMSQADGRGAHVHQDAPVSSFCLLREPPLHAVTLALFVSALAENFGPDLLRMKGIVHVAEEPQHPAVIHGVQHVYHAPEWLDHWPSADRRTRIVFIGRRVFEPWVRGLLDLLDMEVAKEIERQARLGQSK